MSSNAESIARHEARRNHPIFQASFKAQVQALINKVKARNANPKTKKTTFVGGDAFIQLIYVRHKHEAINALILGQLHRLDATIGDASCEERVPLVIDLHERVAAILQDGDVALVQNYINAHANDKVDTKVRTVADALGATHAPAYDALVQRVEAVLSDDDITLARLCYTFTVNSVWSKDEMHLLFSYRSKAQIDVAGEVAQSSSNRNDLIKVEQDLRVELAHATLAAFEEKVANLPRYEAPIPNAPQFFIENQLLLAIQNMRSSIPSRVPHPFQDVTDTSPYLRYELVELPVLPVFNQMFAIFYMMFSENRGIVVRVRRDEMTPIDGSNSKKRYTQKFAGVYYLLFKPNPHTGSFDVAQPMNDDMDRNFMVLDAWSKYHVGTTRTGLDAANLDDHRAALSGCNLLAHPPYAATHPDYAAAAVTKEFDYDLAYKALCVPQPEGVAFHPTREQFPELHLMVNRPNETRPNLHDLWTLARKHGEQRDLHDNCHAIIGSYCRDLYERINRPVDFQVDHVFAASLNWIKADTDALIAKHQAAPDAVFGPFIVRIGESCFSFVELKKARDVLGIKADKQKKSTYMSTHPENASFVRM